MISVTVDGLTVSDPPTSGWVLAPDGLTGWFDGATVRSSSEDRPQQHGAFARQAFRGGRVVTVQGFAAPFVADAESRVTAVLADGGFGDLRVTALDGTTTTASVQIHGAPLVKVNRSGAISFQLQFFAPDPLRYGATINATTGFPTQAGGLNFDLFTNGTADVGYLDFGTAGASGRVQVANPGTADSWPQFQITGPTPAFSIACVDTGDRLYFSRALSSGETLLIDSATGIVTLNGGDVDYSGLLTTAQFFPIRKGGSCMIAFLPDGSTTAGQLTVIARPAWW